MKNIILILLTLTSSIVFSQNYKFGKVDEKIVKSKHYEADTTAKAAYLYKSEIVYHEFDETKGYYIVKEINERVKIYNKDGLDYATKKN